MIEQDIDNAFTFEAARPKLFALAYRMLGSRAEAEDVMQDVWLKWHLAAPTDLHTPAAWLTTVTTRVAIDRLRQLQRERTSHAEGWLPEPWVEGTAPSAEEVALRAAQMSYGVMLLLERLTPHERAAFVLHEAFDCDYAEIARILSRTPAGCRQLVHRAKERLQRATAPREHSDPAAQARFVEGLRAALDTRDHAALLRLFSDALVLVSDAPVRQPEPVALADWVGDTMARAAQSSCTEAVSIDGTKGIALLVDGEIAALFDVSVYAGAMTLRLITGAQRLRGANLVFGRLAILQLLARVRASSVPWASVAMGRHFPVDIHA